MVEDSVPFRVRTVNLSDCDDAALIHCRFQADEVSVILLGPLYVIFERMFLRRIICGRNQFSDLWSHFYKYAQKIHPNK